MRLVRLLGYICAIAGILVLGRDGLEALETRGWQPLSLESLWSEMDQASLAAAQRAVRAHVSTEFWNGFAQVLAQPASIVLLGLGIVLLVMALFSRRSSSGLR